MSAKTLVLQILRVNGTIEQVNKRMTLEEMQAIVGGNIELVTINEQIGIYVDEEHKFSNKPQNELANQMTRGILAADDLIQGDVIVFDLASEEIDEETDNE